MLHAAIWSRQPASASFFRHEGMSPGAHRPFLPGSTRQPSIALSLAKHGLRYPPDPGRGAPACTLPDCIPGPLPPSCPAPDGVSWMPVPAPHLTPPAPPGQTAC